jgi:Leucine-rich repeat (LRR) protein
MSVEILGKSYDINTKELNLNNKNITEIPESISKLSNLKYLYLRSNQLTAIQESISKLVSLKYLDLRHNQLTTLPESIGKLVRLKHLYLHNNQLSTLPESIGNLIKLKHLSLDNNRLKKLPSSIINIKYSLIMFANSYEINNLLEDTEFLIFTWLEEELTNLPTGLKKIWINKDNKTLNCKLNHKLPFGCVIKYF